MSPRAVHGGADVCLPFPRAPGALCQPQGRAAGGLRRHQDEARAQGSGLRGAGGFLRDFVQLQHGGNAMATQQLRSRALEIWWPAQ